MLLLKISYILQNNNYTLHSSSYQDDFTLKGEILHNLLMYIHDTTMLGTQLAIIKHTYSLSDDDVDSFKKIYESVYDLFLSHKFINDKYEYFYERDFYFDIGVAGAFNRKINLGEIFQVGSETYGDFGVENDENFEDFLTLKAYPFI